MTLGADMTGDQGHGPGAGRSGRRWRVVAVSAIAVAAGLAGVAVGVGFGQSGGGSVVTTTVTTGAAASPATLVRELERATTRKPADIAAAAASGVVSILATVNVSGPPLPPGSSEEAVAEGSGLVLDKQGHILTNEHVIESAKKIHVSFGDGTKVHASVLASDPLLDLAVLVVDVPAATLHPLTLGSSAGLRLGDTVVAIGNPFGFERSVSVGVVSGLHRQMTAPNGFTISNAVQTDAAVNHGNSGGPLLDAQGRVIGVNAQIADSGVDANVGVAFAVAIDAAAKQDIAVLRNGGTVRHSWLGVSLDDIDAILATSGRLPATEGALVTGIVAGGPAADAGLRGGSQIVAIDGVGYCLGGDIITSVGGQQVTSTGDLQTEIAAHKPAEKVTLAVVRSNGSKTRVSVTLGTQPTAVPETTTGCG